MKHHAIYEGETMRSFITGNFSIPEWLEILKDTSINLETDVYKLELAV